MAFFFSLLSLPTMAGIAWTMLLFAALSKGVLLLSLYFLITAESRACHNCIFLWNLK